MRKVILTIAIAVMGFTAVFAQDSTKRKMDMQKYTPEQRAEKSTNMLVKKLGLNEEQKTKIYQINLDRAKKMREMYAAGKNGVKGKGKQIKADMDASNTQIEMVLTPEQKTKYNEMKQQMKGKMKDGGKHGMGKGQKDMKPVVSNPTKQG